MTAWATGGGCARGHVMQRHTCSTGGIHVLSHHSRASFWPFTCLRALREHACPGQGPKDSMCPLVTG